jgi:hypothetical protein
VPSSQWSERQKTVQLIIITLAAVVPDFDSGIGWCENKTRTIPYVTEPHRYGTGIASIFALAKQYDTTTGKINNLTSKCVSLLVCRAFV